MPGDPGYYITKMADENEMEDTETEKKLSEKPIVPRSATELQKLKLEKLMKDPVSRNPVIIRDCSSRLSSLSDNEIMPCRIKRCQFPIVQSNGNHQRHLNLFDL